MRVIYLTLAFFVLLGIGATCRTPSMLSRDCAPNNGASQTDAECSRPRGTGG